MEATQAPKANPSTHFNNLGYTLEQVARRLQETPFPSEDLERLALASSYATWPRMHKTNERAVYDMFQHLYSLTFPRKPKNRPRQYDEKDRTFPADQLDVVRQMSRQIISIVLQERFGGYIRDLLTHFRSRDPWVTSPFRDTSWSDLDLLLSSDDSMGFGHILSVIAKWSGFDVETVKRWVQLTAIYPYPTTEEFYVSGRDFYQNHVRTLETFEGLYPEEELKICRVAHDAFGSYFRIGCRK